MTLHIGQKVTMKFDTPFVGMKPGEIAPEFGKIYTIRNLVSFENILLGLQFAEIANPKSGFDGNTYEAHFVADAFRPVVERKTDISIFTAMLNPKPVCTKAIQGAR